MSPTAVVEQLAQQHEAHLRWLRARLQGRLASDEVEDVLQAAYARALTALSAPAPKRPQFARPSHATAWLRTIALNQAHDLARERRGRPGGDRGPRPTHVALDDAACSVLAADVDVEGEVLAVLQRESHRTLVLEAVARLDARHRQILQLRYGRDLPAAAVMVLVGLDRRQWDGRHTRALKAFGRALSSLQVSRECRQTRSLLKASPAVLLQPGRGTTGDHIASCIACAAFSSAARFAMASLPLPLAIEAWRLDAAQVLTPSSSGPQATPASAVAEPGSPALGGATHSAASAGTLAAVVTMTAAALAAGALAGPMRGQTGDSALVKTTPAGAEANGARLADHLTSRQALERTARKTMSRRAGAARRSAADTRVVDSPWPLEPR